MQKILCGAVAAALLAAGSQAHAATITRTYSFKMTDFSAFFPGSPAPVTPLSGSFTVTFDPSVAVYDATVGLTVHNVNLPIGGVFAFDYTPFGMLSLGGIVSPWDQVAAETFMTDDFYVGFFHPLTDPIAPSASYTRAGVNNAWFSDAGVVTAIDGAPAVPEPSAWSLLILGFAGLGSALRRRPVSAVA